MYDWSDGHPIGHSGQQQISNGVVYWYEVKPYVDRFSNRWMPSRREVRPAPDAHCPVNWEDSLEERPEGAE